MVLQFSMVTWVSEESGDDWLRAELLLVPDKFWERSVGEVVGGKQNGQVDKQG